MGRESADESRFTLAFAQLLQLFPTKQVMLGSILVFEVSTCLLL